MIVVAIGVIILWRCRVQPEEGPVWATDRVAGVHTYGFVKLTLERFQLRTGISQMASLPKKRRSRRHLFNFRFWLEADVHPHSELRPLYPLKQTSRWVPLYVCL